MATAAGGALLYAVLRREVRALAVAGLAAAVAAVQLAVVYGGAGEGNLDLRFLGAVRSSSAVDALANWLAVVGPIGTLLAIAFGVLALLAAPVVAAAWAPRGGPAWLVLASAFAVGLVPLLLLTHRGESQLYLTQLGLLGATALAGVGLERLLARAGTRLAVLALGWIAVLLGLAYVPSVLGKEGTDAHALWYGGLVALGCAVALISRRAQVAVLVVVLAALVNVPLDTIAPLARAQAEGTALSVGDDVTPELHEGLSWIRRNTPTDAVLAVNVHDTNRGRFDNFRHLGARGAEGLPRGLAVQHPHGRDEPPGGRARARAAVPRAQAAERRRVRRRPGGHRHARGALRRALPRRGQGARNRDERPSGRLVFSNEALEVLELG